MEKRKIKFITYIIPKYPHALAIFSMDKKSITYIKRLKKRMSLGFLTSLEYIGDCDWYLIDTMRKKRTVDLQEIKLIIEESEGGPSIKISEVYYAN